MSDGATSASRIVGSTIDRPADLEEQDDSNTGDRELFIFEGFSGKMNYTVKVLEEKNGLSKDQINEMILESLEIVDMVFNDYNPQSEVSKFNELKANEDFELSPTLADLLEKVKQVHHLTRGLFNPVKVDGLEVSPVKAPSMKNLIFKEGTISKMFDELLLDVGGIVKGWWLDTLLASMEEKGLRHVYASWGGDIKVLGQHPSGRNWVVNLFEPPSVKEITRAKLDDPEGKKGPAQGPLLDNLSLRSGTAVTTSGDYFQVAELGAHGNWLSHIIDPTTGELLEVTEDNICQATVISSSCLLADAFSTAAIAGKSLKTSSMFMRSQPSLGATVEDYLLYIRKGPQVVRYTPTGKESKRELNGRLKSTIPVRVVVVGGGLAGLSAAVEAAEVGGANVTVLEKEARTGGNSAKATSGINGWGTRFQTFSGVSDDERLFERDTFLSGMGGNIENSMVRTLSTQSQHSIHWLADKFGIDLSYLSQLGGHSRKRTHRVPPQKDGKPVPVGFHIMTKIREYIEKNLSHKITIQTNCTVTKLVWDTTEVGGAEKKTVHGVEYVDSSGNKKQQLAKATVLTTGGFGYDTLGLLKTHRPDLVGVPTTNGSCATGDGMKMAQEIGATMVDMDKVQLHPTGFIDPKQPENMTKYLAPEAVRGSGGLLLNQAGDRFINELDLRSVVSKGIQDNCKTYPMPSAEGSSKQYFAWCVMNEECVRKFGKESFGFYKDRLGLWDEVKGAQGIAALIGCEVDSVQSTIAQYAIAVEQGVCTLTGKNTFPTEFEGGSTKSKDDTVYYVSRVTPSIHYCMGGVQISPSCEVLEPIDSDGLIFGRRRPIRRLFAAGEVTGGVHGANRLGGNSLLECVCFGRIAGGRAASVKQEKASCLTTKEWIPCTLREVRYVNERYGMNTVSYRFNLHGSMQTSGLEVGQYVAIKGEEGGETLLGYFSPITRPHDDGVIGILARDDARGGPIVEYLRKLRPGNACYLRAMGGFSIELMGKDRIVCNNTGEEVEEIGMLAGGTGIAPAVQLIRWYLRHMPNKHSRGRTESVEKQVEVMGSPQLTGIGQVKSATSCRLNLVYAAEEPSDLAFVPILEQIQKKYPERFRFYLVLNRPPLGWCGGVGFIDADIIKKNLFYPPKPKQMIVICGPPIFEKIMCGTLKGMGFGQKQYYAFSQDELI